MPKASANLLADHGAIIVALDAIDRALWLAARGHRNVDFFDAARDFIEVYADGAHYDKEDLLFAAVLAHPMPPAVVPVGCLNMEHDATRAQAHRMRESIAAIRGGNQAEWLTLMDAFVRYTTIIRLHIPKEDGGFFPMSDQLLPDAVHAELTAKFEAIDAALPSPIHAVAAALSNTVNAAVAATLPPPPRQERNHTDKYTLFDDRLGAAAGQLEIQLKRY
jgi:hemerythrin-like domain-containing protein